MLGATFQRFREWLVPAKPHHVETKTFRYTRVINAQHRSDAATEIATGRALILIGAPQRLKWLRFLCPCGCGDELALNLMVSHYPRWTITANVDGISVHPSVVARCGAHFWLRSNTVSWCDQPRQLVKVKNGLLQRIWRWTRRLYWKRG